MLRVEGAIDDRPDGTGLPVTVSVDRNILNVSKQSYERQKRGYDNVWVIVALPGLGKSTIGITTLAPLITDKMSKIFVEFTATNFINRCASPATEDKSTVILDEGFEGFNSGNVAKSEFQQMLNVLMLIRQKHLNVIIITQDFFSLAKSIAIFRSNILFFVTTNKKTGRRGSVVAFGREEKKKLYIYGRKELNYRAVKGNFVAQFNKNDDLMPEDYIQRKAQHLIDQNKELKDAGSLKRRDRASQIMDKTILNLTKLHFKQKTIAKIMGIGYRTLTEHWSKMKARGIVPDEYHNLNSLRTKSSILPTKPPINRLESKKAGAYTILDNPLNTCVGDAPS